MMLIVGLLALNFGVVLPVFAKDTFHGNGGTYGLLTTMLSIGAVLGSLAVGLVHHPSALPPLRRPGLWGDLGRDGGRTKRRRGLCPLAHVGCDGVLLRDSVLDHASAPQFERVSRTHHGALGLCVPRNHAYWQHPHRLDHLGRRPQDRPSCRFGRVLRRRSVGCVCPYAARPDDLLTDLGT